MRYSVFDWNSRKYHYFDGPGPNLGDVIPKGNRVPQGSVVNPECVLPVLPAGAKKIGEGCSPVGRIAVTKHVCNSLSGVANSSSSIRMLLTGLLFIGVGVFVATKIK